MRVSSRRRSFTRTEALRDSLRATVKELAWLTVRYEPGERRPICLFCTRRGGSTWLMEIIAANRGILPLNQPLEILTPNLTPYQYRRLPKFDKGQLVHPDADQERELRGYVDDLLAGRIRVNAPHRFWASDFRFRTDRLLLKIGDAKPMMDWFDTNYDIDMVYLTRHPIPQALSCIRNGWLTSTSAYLRNEWFRAEVIADEQLWTYAVELERSGSELERFVLNWVVENLYPLRVLADRPQWLAISYEECVLDQDRVMADVAARLSLPDLDRMRRAASRASRSSGLSEAATLSAIRSGDREHQVSGWQAQLSEDDRAAAARILDRFGVTVYSAATAEPDWTNYRRRENG
jgi:hypothetical protein